MPALQPQPRARAQTTPRPATPHAPHHPCRHWRPHHRCWPHHHHTQLPLPPPSAQQLTADHSSSQALLPLLPMRQPPQPQEPAAPHASQLSPHPQPLPTPGLLGVAPPVHHPWACQGPGTHSPSATNHDWQQQLNPHWLHHLNSLHIHCQLLGMPFLAATQSSNQPVLTRAWSRCRAGPASHPPRRSTQPRPDQATPAPALPRCCLNRTRPA